MAKVYISAHDADAAKTLASDLRAAGHDIVSAWHEDLPLSPPREDVEAWEAKANANFDLIETADALVLVSGPAKCHGGKFVEAGYALASNVGVVCYGRRENGMCAAFDLAANLTELLELLTN